MCFKFGQQVFAVVKVVINIMIKINARRMVLVDREKILPSFLLQMNFYLGVKAGNYTPSYYSPASRNGNFLHLP